MTTDNLLGQLGAAGVSGVAYRCGTCGEPMVAGQGHACTPLQPRKVEGVIFRPDAITTAVGALARLEQTVAALTARVEGLETALADILAGTPEKPQDPALVDAETLMEKRQRRR